MTRWAVVVPTVGRASLALLLGDLATGVGPAPDRVVVVDDRPQPAHPPLTGPASLPVLVAPSAERGPAAARNVGWRAAGDVDWVVFVDDDVRLPPTWCYDVVTDLEQADRAGVDGVQGRLTVPQEGGPRRRPDDWTRSTLGLEGAAWVTADMAYRVRLLDRLGGFDERFPRAYREDADLALRALDAGALLVRGEHRAIHPVRPAGPFVSVGRQRGNADDALMQRLHGSGWRTRASAHRGALRRHVVTTAAGLATVATGVSGRRRASLVLGAWWATRTLRFTLERVAPGPRTADEVARMAVTSVLIPPAAVAWRLAGQWRHRHATPWPTTSG